MYLYRIFKLFTKWEVPQNTDAHLVKFYVGKYITIDYDI